jgi:hypothetical protein
VLFVYFALNCVAFIGKKNIPPTIQLGTSKELIRLMMMGVCVSSVVSLSILTEE